MYGVRVALNIKNEKVCRLAREAARCTGTTPGPAALETALERFLADLDEAQQAKEAELAATVADLTHIVERFNSRLTDADRDQMRRFMVEMYDEDGLLVDGVSTLVRAH